MHEKKEGATQEIAEIVELRGERYEKQGDVFTPVVKTSAFEKMGGTYVREGDYLVPNSLTQSEEAGPVMKYGSLRRDFLHSKHRLKAFHMHMNGTLIQHLVEIDEQAQNLLEHLKQQMLEQDPAPDKREHPTAWLQHMSNIEQRAEEVVLKEIVYV